MQPADAVSAFLEAGGDPAKLAPALFERGWVTPGSAVVATDVDGDEDLDLVAGLDPLLKPDRPPRGGSVFLWRCEDGAYRLTQAARPSPEFESPVLQEARDITGDEIPELLVAYPRCGAHTCFTQYTVLQWDGSFMADVFRGASDDMPSPELAIVFDDPPAPAAIEVTAKGIGSVGAGPYRVWSRLWTWDEDSGAFVPGEPLIEPPRFRIHAIHDADDAFARGDVAAALTLYGRVIEDDGLLDWPAAGDRRPELAAYAGYRRLLTFLLSGDALSAQAELDRWPAGGAASVEAYAELARRLVADFAGAGAEAACAAASAFARENPDTVLAPLDFGYANRTYAADDICPMSGT
jgi:hypothetical protein